MSAPYRVSGRGRDRQIFDGARLVGTIHSDGWTWFGRRPDGVLVQDATGAVVRIAAIARWRTPNLWRSP